MPMPKLGAVVACLSDRFAAGLGKASAGAIASSLDARGPRKPCKPWDRTVRPQGSKESQWPQASVVGNAYKKLVRFRFACGPLSVRIRLSKKSEMREERKEPRQEDDCRIGMRPRCVVWLFDLHPRAFSAVIRMPCAMPSHVRARDLHPRRSPPTRAAFAGRIHGERLHVRCLHLGAHSNTVRHCRQS